MPPRRGIVKSGNAGNSSKAAKAPAAKDDQKPATPEKEALFPPGYKYPLTILNERCGCMFCFIHPDGSGLTADGLLISPQGAEERLG